MNFTLTIDKQPLTLKLEAILALFGKDRTMDFAEGKWTPDGVTPALKAARTAFNFPSGK